MTTHSDLPSKNNRTLKPKNLKKQGGQSSKNHIFTFLTPLLHCFLNVSIHGSSGIYKYFHEVPWVSKLLSHYGSRTKDNSSSSLHFQDNMKVLLHIHGNSPFTHATMDFVQQVEVMVLLGILRQDRLDQSSMNMMMMNEALLKSQGKLY